MTTLRRDQKPPTWHVWGMAAGRGAGKRFAALSWLNDAMQGSNGQNTGPLRAVIVVPRADQVQFAVEELQKINPDITYKPNIRRLEWPVNETARDNRVHEAIRALDALRDLPRDHPVVEFAQGIVRGSVASLDVKDFAFITSSDEPDTLRGVQAHYAVGINLHNWYEPIRFGALSALDNLRIATRLGRAPQLVLTHSTDYEKIDGATYTMG